MMGNWIKIGLGAALLCVPGMLAACDDGALPASGEMAGGEQSSGPAPDLSHTFPALTIAPGEEVGAGVEGPCQIWTLGNEETLWVNRILARNDGGWHHSNWWVMQEGDLSVSDGTFKCLDEGIVRPMGQVFFAQTTQSLSDVQDLGEGVAFEVPPHSIVVGQMHMLNVADEPLDTTLSFDVFTVPEEEVVIPLRSSTLSMQQLDLPPGEKTQQEMICEVPPGLQGEQLHYVLPHYHAAGRRLFIETTYDDGTSELLFEGHGYGEASGQMLTDRPALGTSLRMGCDYDNETDARLGWGFSGADEMCVALLYTTSEERLFGSDLLGSCGFLPM